MGFNSAFKGLSIDVHIKIIKTMLKNCLTWGCFVYCFCLKNYVCETDIYVKFPAQFVEASWNVMAHTQKPDFVFRRNGLVHLNRPGASVQSTTGSRGERISGSNAGYTKFQGSVKGTGYPLHSPVSPSLLLLCLTVCHHISTGVYLCFGRYFSLDILLLQSISK